MLIRHNSQVQKKKNLIDVETVLYIGASVMDNWRFNATRKP